MTDQAQYQRIGFLIQTAPSFGLPVTPEMQRWLGEVRVALKPGNDILNVATFENAVSSYLSSATFIRDDAPAKIMQCLYNALAAANQNAPASAQGAFIPVGSAFDAIAAVGKILDSATQTVLFVDPYADAQILETFATQAAEKIVIRVLADATHVKPDLKPAAAAWSRQYSGMRPLEVKVATARTLHDRLIALDDNKVWTVSQSFNAIATRSPASIIRVDADTTALKIGFYGNAWLTAAAI